MEYNGCYEEKIKNEKLKLHIKYISLFAFAGLCMVIILNFCEDSFFKNCISVTSTVTSIILSVIAIILSVTGERTTNEIRNKVVDSVDRLEDYTDKSMNMAKELSTAIQQMNELYKNVEMLPQMNSSLNYLLDIKRSDNKKSAEGQSDDDLSANHIINFIEKTNQNNLLEAYYYFITEMKKRPFNTNDMIEHLIKKGNSIQDSTYLAGVVLGSFITGTVQDDSASKLVEAYEKSQTIKQE